MREEESREDFRERGWYIKREKRGCDEDGGREEDRFRERKGRRTRERQGKQDIKRENGKERERTLGE